MNRIALLSTTPVLRGIIYALVGVIGAVGVIAGAIDPQNLGSWFDQVPAIAATVGSVLALANIAAPASSPQQPPAQAAGSEDPTAEYARQLRARQTE